MARVVGKAFKITKQAVKNYGYARPGMSPNPAVTTIAAVNGRGAYEARSARAAMQGKGPAARSAHAKNLTAVERRAFAERMRQARAAKRPASRPSVSGTRRRTVRSASPGRIPARPRPASQAATGGPMRANVTAAQRRAALANLKKARASLRKNKKRGGRKSSLRANRKPMSANRRRKKSMRRNGKQTAAQRRASLRNLSKARRARKGGKKRSMKSNRKKSVRRKSMRRNGKQTAAQRRASLRNLAKARRSRKGKKRSMKSNRKKSVRRKSMRRNGKQTAAQRRASLRNLAKARRSRKGKKRSMKSNRKKMRRNTWYGETARHRKASKKGWRKRKGYKANRGKLFKKNGLVDGFMVVAKTGAVVLGGFVAHKALTKIFADFVLDKIVGAQATPAAPPKPAATSGLEALQPYKGLIAGAVVTGVGVYATDKLVKDVKTKMLLSSGMVVSFLHTLLVTALAKAAPQAVDYLAGYEDGTAARLSAMYGLGGGTSILPHYAAINGMGEYFSEPMHGLGEYFSEPMRGLGEYFSESPVSGLGSYGANPDMMQAAAGYGVVEYNNGNHVNPSSDLDRELTIAEAAAGVGQAYEAAAGLPSYEASAGMGSIASLPSTDTWVPGTSNPQLWAGTRGITKSQSATSMVPAGILQTDGGGGVFG